MRMLAGKREWIEKKKKIGEGITKAEDSNVGRRNQKKGLGDHWVCAQRMKNLVGNTKPSLAM